MDSPSDPLRQLVAPIEQLLASGGDTRLALDPVSRLNGYGCRPFPRPDAFTFASSTATSISGRAYAAAAAARQRLLRDSRRGSFERAFSEQMRALRDELRGLLGLEASACEIVFSCSRSPPESASISTTMSAVMSASAMRALSSEKSPRSWSTPTAFF